MVGLASGVTAGDNMLFVALAPGSNVLNNYNSTSNPTVNDDSGDGYAIGSVWANKTLGRVYVCVDDSVGAAVWLYLGVEPTVYSQTYAGTITCDLSAREVIDVTLTGNVTDFGFSNGLDGKKYTLRLRQDGSGSHTVVWNSACRNSNDLSWPTVTSTASKLDYICFAYNSADGKYDILGVNQGF